MLLENAGVCQGGIVGRPIGQVDGLGEIVPRVPELLVDILGNERHQGSNQARELHQDMAQGPGGLGPRPGIAFLEPVTASPDIPSRDIIHQGCDLATRVHAVVRIERGRDVLYCNLEAAEDPPVHHVIRAGIIKRRVARAKQDVEVLDVGKEHQDALVRFLQALLVEGDVLRAHDGRGKQVEPDALSPYLSKMLPGST